MTHSSLSKIIKIKIKKPSLTLTLTLTCNQCQLESSLPRGKCAEDGRF